MGMSRSSLFGPGTRSILNNNSVHITVCDFYRACRVPSSKSCLEIWNLKNDYIVLWIIFRLLPFNWNSRVVRNAIEQLVHRTRAYPHKTILSRAERSETNCFVRRVPFLFLFALSGKCVFDDSKHSIWCPIKITNSAGGHSVDGNRQMAGIRRKPELGNLRLLIVLKKLETESKNVLNVRFGNLDEN